jgi:glycosyltransferase involved in cell wall biosynthesis
MFDYKICLIVNVRNGDAYLSECLESLCMQDYDNFRIFIFDNHSTDKTSKISKNFINKYKGVIQYCKLPEFMPINVGRNYALRYIINNNRGEFSHFSFCDSDDHWSPEWLSNISRFLDKKSVIYTDGFELKGDSLYPVEVNHLEPKYAIFSSRIYLQGTVIPFSYVNNPPFFDERVNYCIDVDKWNELFYAGVPFLHVQKKLFYYRIHENSLSSSGFKRVMSERWILTKKYRKSKLIYLIKFVFYSTKHLLLRL